MVQNVAECLKMKNYESFKSDISIVKDYALGDKKDSMVLVMMKYKDNEKTTHEEKLIYDFPDMVSQLGGILSLFLGFSVFSVICDVIDHIKMKIWRKEGQKL